MRETPAPLRERTGAAAGASRTAAPRALLRREFVTATIAGVFMAFTGAFNTQHAPLLVRLAYWLGLLWVGAGLGRLTAWLLERLGSFETRPILTSAVLAVVLTIPMTLLVWLATGWVFHVPETWGTLLWFTGPVFLVCAVMTAINSLAERQPAETHAAVPGQAPVRFLERLPLPLRGSEIYAVQAEDHYLRLHTSRGSDLILMRLSDAMAELEGLEGAQTHRSWWVAKDAVTAARTTDGRAVLTLKSGAEAPVSRTYVKALRQARWW